MLSTLEWGDVVLPRFDTDVVGKETGRGVDGGCGGIGAN